jgi:hypothetical protein
MTAVARCFTASATLHEASEAVKRGPSAGALHCFTCFVKLREAISEEPPLLLHCFGRLVAEADEAGIGRGKEEFTDRVGRAPTSKVVTSRRALAAICLLRVFSDEQRYRLHASRAQHAGALVYAHVRACRPGQQGESKHAGIAARGRNTRGHHHARRPHVVLGWEHHGADARRRAEAARALAGHLPVVPRSARDHTQSPARSGPRAGLHRQCVRRVPQSARQAEAPGRLLGSDLTPPHNRHAIIYQRGVDSGDRALLPSAVPPC